MSAVVLVAVLFALGACAAGPNMVEQVGAQPAGFWLGLWQGIIVPITFIISLFTDEVSIYEVRNDGNWYDFGFMLGLGIPLFSGGASRRAYRNRQ